MNLTSIILGQHLVHMTAHTINLNNANKLFKLNGVNGVHMVRVRRLAELACQLKGEHVHNTAGFVLVLIIYNKHVTSENAQPYHQYQQVNNKLIICRVKDVVLTP